MTEQENSIEYVNQFVQENARDTFNCVRMIMNWYSNNPSNSNKRYNLMSCYADLLLDLPTK